MYGKNLVGVAAILVLAGAGTQQKEKSDSELMQGSWAVTSSIVDGKTTPKDKISGLVMTLKDDKYTSQKNGKTLIEGKFKIDSSKKPKTLDLSPTKGPNKGKTFLAIYKIDGDTMTWCGTFSENAPRPDDFIASKGSGRVLLTMQRKK